MLNEHEIKMKLFDRAELFKFYFYRQQYLEAALCVDNIKTVALFIGLDQKTCAELLGDRQQEPPAEGVIDEKYYLKACEWCIFKGGYDKTRHTYQNVEEMRKKGA